MSSKCRCLIFGLTTAIVVALQSVLFAHQQKVHEQITAHAANSAQNYSYYYKMALRSLTPQTGLFEFTTSNVKLSPSGWLCHGSFHEDDTRLDLGGIRSYNHFYDPLSQQGLSNFPPDQVLPSAFGWNSFVWGAKLNCKGLDASDFPSYGLGKEESRNVNTLNAWSFQNARTYEMKGFTDPDPVVRSSYLAKAFRSLGQVMHLLQDTTSPQHVRNEQHLDESLLKMFFESPFEKYGGRHVGSLKYQEGILDWWDGGFNKLEDFWNRHYYTWDRKKPNIRSPEALVDSEDETLPFSRLGLAEWVNGNFIGDRHGYREKFNVTDLRHYPFPSVLEGTDYSQLRVDPLTYKKPTSLLGAGGGVQTYRLTASKIAQGVHVPNHSALSYAAYRNPDVKTIANLAGIDDDDVLQNYHDLLIPKAIEYSAGLIDYFFRCLISCQGTWQDNKVRLTVRNYSRQDLGGGVFSVYWDSPSGVRTKIQDTTSDYSGSLHHFTYNGEECHVSFTPPNADVSRYYLVFTGGSLGVSTTGAALDSVDQGQVVAMSSFSLFWFVVTSTDPAGFSIWVDRDFGAGDGFEEGYSGDTLMYLDDVPFGQFFMCLNAFDQFAPGRNVSGTIKTFFNSSSRMLSTENFTVLTQGLGLQGTTYCRTPIVIGPTDVLESY